MLNTLVPEGSKRKQWLKESFLEPKVSPHLTKNFKALGEAELASLSASLRENFFTHEAPDYLSTDVGRRDMNDHLTARLEQDRRHRIPWLDNTFPLQQAKVLELGCGTGASTVALAEQGAEVVAVDIDKEALVDARKRMELYGLQAEFHQLNAAQVGDAFAGQHFDFIIFWACLEHMTIEERLEALRKTWDMVPPGRFWCITDTPNRLHFFDAHTSGLPFFFWLPDDLAMEYARFSPRLKLRESLQTSKDMESFYRWGRGMSFHEFELSIAPMAELNIVSCMLLYEREQRMLSKAKARVSPNARYEAFLHECFPQVPRGFLQPDLDLIIRKD